MRRLGVGGSKLDCSCGNSPPNILGLRWMLARGLAGRRAGVSLLLLDAGDDLGGFRVRDNSGDLTGEVGGLAGEAVFTRAFFAFILRSFSSSSDDVASESLPLRLMAPELRFETAPKDGARFKPWPGPYNIDPANDSVRLIRCMRGSTAGMTNESDEFDISDMDLRRRGMRELEWLELRVVELGVEGKKACPPGVRKGEVERDEGAAYDWNDEVERKRSAF